jgi:hypothetical protein
MSRTEGIILYGTIIRYHSSKHVFFQSRLLSLKEGHNSANTSAAQPCSYTAHAPFSTMMMAQQTLTVPKRSVAPAIEQRLHDLGVTLPGSSKQWCVASILRFVNVASTLDQRLNHLGILF